MNISKAMFVIVILAALTTACRGTPTKTPPPAGYVFVNGKYIEPPYKVEVIQGDIRLNGLVVRPNPQPTQRGTVTPLQPPTTPQTAIDLVAVAVARLQQWGIRDSSGLSPEKRSELINLIKSYATVAAVRDEGYSIVVTDRNGQEALLLLELTQPPTPEEILSAQKAEAEEWMGTLESGGVLLISPGATVEIPSPQVTPFFAKLFAAFQQPEPQRLMQLEDLVGALSIAKALQAAGEPPSSLRKRLPDPLPPHQSLLNPLPAESNLIGGRLFSPLLDKESHKDSKTPKSDMAYIFEIFPVNSGRRVIEAAKLHQYRVVHYTRTPPFPGEVTIENFKKSSGAGILYLEVHGLPGKLYIEQYDKLRNDEERKNAVEEIKKADEKYKKMDIPVHYSQQATGEVFLYLKDDEISKVWQEAQSIVELTVCYGLTLEKAFNAREFIAFPEKCNAIANALAFNVGFWGDLDGTLDTGTKRNVGDAFDNPATPKRGYELKSRATPRGATVLSPAVADHGPVDPVVIGTEVVGKVSFDTPIKNVEPKSAVVLGGDCKPLPGTSEWKWEGDRTLLFPFIPQQPLTLTIQVLADKVRSADNNIPLDGNQDPQGTDHVGPNGDNYIWEVKCVVAVAPPPAQLPPQTDTPTPRKVGLVSPTGKWRAVMTVFFDPAGHAQYVGMPGDEEIDVEEGSITFRSSPPWVTVTGNLNPDGTFMAVGTGDVAGRHVIGVEFKGKITSSELSGDYAMGVKVVTQSGGKQVIGGLLPTGQPIIYHVEGQRKGAALPSPTAVATPLVVDARLRTFIDNFVPALRSNDTTFLFQHLHPAVLNLYGTDQCRTFINRGSVDPTINIVILGVKGPAPFPWISDGISTLVPNVYTLDANVTVQGTTERRDIHFGQVGNDVYWFTSCGNPRVTPTPLR